MLSLIAAIVLSFADPSPAAPAPGSLYVYLGRCDPAGGGWQGEAFDGLPDCAAKADAKPREIIAKRGVKARDALPSGGAFGVEALRVRRGQRVRLVALRSVQAKDPAPGPKAYWGEIERP
jgi:hypothetical protein